jgi:H+/Cl- antiporter ClcA
VAVAAAAWLVRRFSAYASGSGVPEVEAALAGTLPPAPLRRILLIKFIGGTLSLGAGMMLGPEGPGVQMGAVGARLLGTLFRRPWADLHALIAAGAGAGIAVAFNAPSAGAVFVLEELVRRLDTRIVIAGLGASSTAIIVSRLMLGDGPEFHVAAARGALAQTTVAAALVAIFGLGAIVAGVCRMDPMRGYPPGAQSGTPTTLSWHHQVHDIAGPVMFLAIFGACLSLAGRLQGLWRLYTILTAVAGLALAIWTAVAWQKDARNTGLAQRALILVYYIWVVLLGVHLI